MTNTYDVTATQWEGGWELDIAGEGVTQCRTLDGATKAVRDYLSLLHDADEGDAVVNVLPAIDQVGDALAGLIALQTEISDATDRMQAERLRIMRDMKVAGFSYADIAGAVGISKGRVSQLISG